MIGYHLNRGRGPFEIGRPRSSGWKNFGHRQGGVEGWRLLKTGQFSWTSYVYHPLLKSSSLHLYYLIKIGIFNLILAIFFSFIYYTLYVFFIQRDQDCYINRVTPTKRGDHKYGYFLIPTSNEDNLIYAPHPVTYWSWQP